MTSKKKSPKILIAGVGNELRQDDAFGILTIRKLQEQFAPHKHIKFQEVGIGGIHLVQELYEKYDILVIIDAVKWGGAPGQLYFRAADTEDLEKLPKDEQRAFLADMHYTNPVRAMILAKALKILPEQVFILGCEVKDHDDFDIGVSDEIKKSIPLSINRLCEWLQSFDYNLN